MSFADPVIGAIILQNVPDENRICLVSYDSGGHDSVCSLNVAVAMIHGDDFCVFDFSHKKSLHFCIDFPGSSYLRGTGLLWEKHTKNAEIRH